MGTPKRASSLLMWMIGALAATDAVGMPGKLSGKFCEVELKERRYCGPYSCCKVVRTFERGYYRVWVSERFHDCATFSAHGYTIFGRKQGCNSENLFD